MKTNFLTKKSKGLRINPVAGLRRKPDVKKLSGALASRGIDTRFWLAAGTVGSVADNGTFVAQGEEAYIGEGNDERALAVATETDGIIVDVRLEPLGTIITARYHGISCGYYGAVLVPISPGDEVIVGIPDGDFNSPAITILAIAANEQAPIPSDWNNDRMLIEMRAAVEIRAPAISLESNALSLNGRRVGRSPEAI